MPETPYPTIEQYRAIGDVAGSRSSVVLRELKRRLEATLLKGSAIDLITDFNTQKGYTEKSQIVRHPKFIGGAPVVDTDGFFNGITIGLSKQLEFQGNRHMKSEYALSIYSIDNRIDTEEQFWQGLDRIEIVQKALYPFLSGCVNAQNIVCWRSLQPLESGFSFEDWEECGSAYAIYKLICDPSQNTWS